MPEKFDKVKKHITRHRAKYAVVATLAVVVAFDRSRVKEWNNFLSEHNLLDTYYTNNEE